MSVMCTYGITQRAVYARIAASPADVPTGATGSNWLMALASFSGAPCTSVIETGYYARSPLDQNGFTRSTYHIFSLWQSPTGSRAFITPVTPDYRFYDFSIQYFQGNRAQTVFEGITYDSSIVGVGDGGCNSTVGHRFNGPLESLEASEASTGDWFNVGFYDNSNAYHFGFTPIRTATDRPCPSYNCFNGAAYNGGTRWQSNKFRYF